MSAIPVKLKPMKMKQAFTLLELMVTIGIIGVISGVVIIAVNPQKQLADADEQRQLAGADAIKDAFQQFQVDQLPQWQETMKTVQDEITDATLFNFLNNDDPTAYVCPQGMPAEGCVDLDFLTPDYLVEIPENVIVDPALQYSGFEIALDAENRPVISPVNPNPTPVGSTEITATYGPDSVNIGLNNVVLAVTFSKEVEPVPGELVQVFRDNGLLVEQIDAFSFVSIDNLTWQYALPTLEYGVPYYVQMPETAFCVVPGNCFAGISDNTTWAFETVGPHTLASANLRLWLDAADRGTLFTSDNCTTGPVNPNENVGCWTDKAQNNHVRQTNSTQRPQWILPSQNNSTLLFDGAGDYLTGGDVLDIDNTDPFTMVYVFKLTAVPSIVQRIFSKTLGTSTAKGYLVRVNANGMNGFYLSNNWTGSPSTSNILRFEFPRDQNTNFQKNAIIHNGSSTLAGMSLYTGGAPQLPLAGAVDQLTATTLTAYSFNVGTYNNQTTNTFRGNVAEILIYDNVLSPADIQAVHDYIATKWGV